MQTVYIILASPFGSSSVALLNRLRCHDEYDLVDHSLSFHSPSSHRSRISKALSGRIRRQNTPMPSSRSFRRSKVPTCPRGVLMHLLAWSASLSSNVAWVTVCLGLRLYAGLIHFALAMTFFSRPLPSSISLRFSGLSGSKVSGILGVISEYCF